MKLLKLYAVTLGLLFLLDICVPHHAYAAFPRGIAPIPAPVTNPNACGVSSNNWCVDLATGWTVFTANNATGTCPGTDATTGPCFASADNSTAASFNGTITGNNTLTINSGSNPSIGQSVVLNGVAIATITAGTGPFTLAGAPANQTSDLTSSPGNDTTCILSPPPTAVYLSTSLSTFVPSKPCYTQSRTFAIQRLVNPKTFTASMTATINNGLMQVTVCSACTGTGAIMVGGILGGGTLASNSFTGTMTGTTTLTINSGTPPSNNDSVFRASGTFLGYVVSGGGTSTVVLSASATFASEVGVTSAAPMVVTGYVAGSGTFGGVGFYTVTPSAGTVTAGSATLKRITATRDWFLTKKGTTWPTGSIGAVQAGAWNANGWSQVDLSVITAYGVGARPHFVTPDQAQTDCFHSQGARGYQTAIVGYWCTNPFQDPTSASYGTYTISADVGPVVCTQTSSFNGTVTSFSAQNLTSVLTVNSGTPPSIGDGVYATTGLLYGKVASGAGPFNLSLATQNSSGSIAMVGGPNSVCNTTTPAAVQTNPTRYRASATGSTTIALNAASGTTATLASPAGWATTVGTGKINIQLTNTTVGAGIGTNEFDIWIVEDNKIEYGAIGPQNTSNVPTDIPFARIRRNLVTNQYTANGFGGDVMFIGYGQFGGSHVSEENLWVAGGWVPATWAAYADSHSHNLYLHNPSSPVNQYSEINAYNSADNQWRDAGTDYNGLFLYQYGVLTTQTQYNAANVSYTVTQNGYGIPVGTRTATAADTGTVLHLDGVISTTVGMNIVNLTNPGSIPSNCTISSIRDAATVNLSCTLTTGNRGNGVQTGDILRISSGSPFGIFLTPGGQYTNGGFYPGPSNVTVSAASPSTITDTKTRAQGVGEPFSFSPVIITAAGSGYGTSLSGTLTWAGTGCSVNPVINVVTNAQGVIAGYTGITTAGTCTTPPTSTNASWVGSGGLSAGSGATLAYNMSMGTLPTGVSLSTNTGSCTGSLVTNTTSGLQVCTYYSLGSGTSYTFAATPGGTAINASGSNGTTIQRTGSANFNFNPSFAAPIFPGTVSLNVTAGMAAMLYESGAQYFSGSQSQTHVLSVSADRTKVATEDGTVTDSAGTAQFTMMFGLPTPCTVTPGCLTSTIGPNNIMSHPEGLVNNSPAFAIQLAKPTSGVNTFGNYIFNWNPTTTSNVNDLGFPGSNNLVSAGNCSTTACILNSASETRFPKANIEYYDASQLEAGNTFSGYISNGSGSAGYILTITSGSPPTLAVPTNINYGVGDTIFDTTGSANVVAQYTRVLQQIDATHYLVSVSQAAGSSGTPIQMMYGSTDRFIAKAASQSKDSGWNFAYTAGAGNDYIRAQLQCGDQTTFPSSPACPAQGQTIH